MPDTAVEGVMALVMAIDQGSGSSRALVFETDTGTPAALGVVAQASEPVESFFPADRHVEHDAEELYETCRASAESALAAAGADWTDLAGVGITGQTETIVAWDRDTGEAVARAISWRDQRTAELMDALNEASRHDFTARTGLPVAPTWSAPKIRWILDAPGSRAAELARQDRLALGDVASWVAYRLSAGQAHVTEPSFASRTGLMNLASRGWDPVLLELFDVPVSALPEIRPSDALDCRVAVPDARTGPPIISALGDQQAALYGHGGRRPGQAKITMGTGAFLWANAGPTPPESTSGLVATCAWAPRDRPLAYALEGFLPNAGAVVTWLRTLGLLADDAWPDLGPDPVRSQHLQALPAIAGLGTPYWAPHARAVIEGMDAGTTRQDVVNACILGVVQLIADAIDSTTATVPTDVVMLDGGMSQNDSIAQALADLTGTTIHRSREEATATGIALLTAHALGLVPGDTGAVQHDAVFTPRLDTTARTHVRTGWHAFVDRALAAGQPPPEPAPVADAG
jgi:glycerol kinase